MKRLLLVFVTLAVTISLAATPSMAAAKSTVGLAPQAPSDPSAIYVPADDLAKTLRDKMPFISSEPTLVGNNLIWDVDIAPMRLKAKKGVTLLDRVGGTVFVSRAGVDIRRLTKGNAKSRLTLTKVVPSRVITKAGPQQFQITLPANLARELRALPSSA